MTRYSPLPLFDLEMQTSGKAIQSITISKETRPDGSVVRKKETLLADGTCLVDERLLSKAPFPAPSNIQWIPITIETPPVASILPLHSSIPPSKDNRPGRCSRILCTSTVLILLTLLLIQALLFYLLKRGADDLHH